MILLLLVGVIAVGWVMFRRRERVDRRRELANVAVHLGRAARGGATLTEAVRHTTPLVRGRPAAALRRIELALDHGVSVAEAFDEWAAQDRSGASKGRPGDVELLVAAARFGDRHGGDMGAAFESVALTLIDRAELAEETSALLSQSRASVAVLCTLPVLGACVLSSLDPAVGELLIGSGLGWACIAVAVVLDLGAAVVSEAMVRKALR